MRHKNIISKMTLEEKIAFCSGRSFWETEEFKHLGIPSLFLSDGPHGLRKQEGDGDHLGLNASVLTTCFPTASAVSTTWDLALVEEMGEALGKEAIEVGTNVILGPGTNMKRNPLCGRNFEYYSEDPYLSGKLSAAWINGVQQTGTGVSLKHFALNNQELKRMSTNVLVDERALREYYLPAFEIAVKESKPTTLMCAYNKIDGTYASDHKRLLTDILREEWEFDGAVVTDWGAMNDRVEAFKAGLDLEMPGSNGHFDEEVKMGVERGELDEVYIDASVDRLLTLIERTSNPIKVSESAKLFKQNQELARKIAAASGVLLKNEENSLPLQSGEQIAVIGELARTPRYQGSGSSQVTPTRVTSLLDSVKSYTNNINFAAGYSIFDQEDESLIKEAVKIAKTSQVVVLTIGLTDIYESEGFDRDHMRIPNNQIDLIEAISKVNDNIMIVLVGGSAIEMDWEHHAKAILHMQLAGQEGGSAAADLLFGKECPSGKLTESYPFSYRDTVNSSYYNVNPKQTAYKESMFCGYRYFNTARIPVRYPFGYGLSYTEFEYSDMKVTTKDKYDINVRVTIKNIGEYDAAEIAQLYIEAQTEGVYRPAKELKGFNKVNLKQGESKQIYFTLDKRSFEVYDYTIKDWVVEAGEYSIQVGTNVEDVRLRSTIILDGIIPEKSKCTNWYYTLQGEPSREDFVSVYGEFEDYVPLTKGTYDLTSSIMEMKETSLFCKAMYKGMEKVVAKQSGGKIDYSNPSFKMMMYAAADNPIKAMPLFSPESMTINRVAAIVDLANGKPIRALRNLMRKSNLNG